MAISRERLRELCDRVIARSPADSTDVLVNVTDKALTRLGDNVITQNVAASTFDIRVHVQIGQKEGVATANQFDDAALQAAIDAAVTVAHLQPDNPELLPPVEPGQTYASVESAAQPTRDCDPARRAALLATCVEAARASELKASGIAETTATTIAIANSRGLFLDHDTTSATLSITTETGDASGWCSDFRTNVDDLDANAIVQVAIDKALRSKGAVAIQPGRYDVILEPSAVGDLVMFLNYMGFNALTYLERRSFLAGKLNEKVFGDNFTVADDPLHADVASIPFDFEGTPRKHVQLIEAGVLKSVCHDRRTAKQVGIEPTGHGLPLPNPGGGLAFSVTVAPGEATLDDMVRNTKRGLYITQFHYNNVVNPMAASITGMTRNGTWLIENGAIVKPVKNLRYTESLLHAFGNIAAIGKTQERRSAFFGGTSLVPAMHVRDFNFSSSTDF